MHWNQDDRVSGSDEDWVAALHAARGALEAPVSAAADAARAQAARKALRLSWLGGELAHTSVTGATIRAAANAAMRDTLARASPAGSVLQERPSGNDPIGMIDMLTAAGMVFDDDGGSDEDIEAGAPAWRPRRAAGRAAVADGRALLEMHGEELQAGSAPCTHCATPGHREKACPFGRIATMSQSCRLPFASLARPARAESCPSYPATPDEEAFMRAEVAKLCAKDVVERLSFEDSQNPEQVWTTAPIFVARKEPLVVTDDTSAAIAREDVASVRAAARQLAATVTNEYLKMDTRPPGSPDSATPLSNGRRHAQQRFYSAIAGVKRVEDSKPRLVYDARELNEFLADVPFSLPRSADLIHGWQPGGLWAAIDLSGGFYHIRVARQDRKFLCFSQGTETVVDYDGVARTVPVVYRFKRLPFGLSVAPFFFRHVDRNRSALHAHAVFSVGGGSLP